MIGRVRFDHFRRLFERYLHPESQGTVIERRTVGSREFLLVVLDEPLVFADSSFMTSLWVNRVWVSEFPAESEQE